MTTRAAARDSSVPVETDGRPASVSPEAAAEVGLALTMSQFGAALWADLALNLRWRLPGTLAALSEGRIDLSRVRLIAELTSVLSDDDARTVEERVLERAGQQTPGQLRAALRRAVITVDPAAAERRREEAERRARVGLYADQEGTATISGHNLPGVQACAAMARITALAQAMKAAGADGGIDMLRAQVLIGLLLNTRGFGRDVRLYGEHKSLRQALRELRRVVTRNDAWLFVDGSADTVTTQFTHNGEPVMLDFLLHCTTDGIDWFSGLRCQHAFIQSRFRACT